jgi:ABC-type transporter MlaC component
MNVTLTLTFATAALAAAALSKLDSEVAATPSADKAEGKTVKKDAEKAADKPKDTPPAVDPNKAYLDSGIPELIQKLVAKDRAAAKALLTKYGASKGAELKAADHDKFKAEITEALEGSLA